MPSEREPTSRPWTDRSYPVQEDMGLQRTTWHIERCGWLALAVLVAAALLGLLAHGPLSSATATGGADGAVPIYITYERFVRSGATTRMEIRVPSAAPRQAIRVGASLLDAVRVEALHPRPAAERNGPDGAVFIFDAMAGTPLRIHIDMRPEQAGMTRAEIGIAGMPPVRFTQFILP